MKRTVLALTLASLSFAAFGAPPPTAGPVNVNVVSPVPLPVTGNVNITSSSTSPVNVAVVNGNAPQAVNQVSQQSMGTAQYWVSWPTFYVNQGDMPVMLTSIGVSLSSISCDTGPDFLEARVGDEEGDDYSFGVPVAKIPTADGKCHYAGTLPNALVVPPGGLLGLKLHRPNVGTALYFRFAISGFVME